MKIRHHIKHNLLKWFPDISLKLFSARSRRLIERNTVKNGSVDLARYISKRSNASVLSGPFTGLLLDYNALKVHTAPKFLGTYEKEITTFVERAITRQPSVVLNVGTSEGYYAVGFATRLPSARVFAAEADPKSLSATLTNASLNKVRSRVFPIGILRKSEFSNYLKKSNSLIFMDCEGFEFELLDLEADPILQSVDIIVEIHDKFGSADTIIERFRDTHEIASATARKRTLADTPLTINEPIPIEALDERRGATQQWLYLQTRTAEK